MEEQADKVSASASLPPLPAAARPCCLPLSPPTLLSCPLSLQFREQKKHNALLLVAASRGYLADVRQAGCGPSGCWAARRHSLHDRPPAHHLP